MERINAYENLRGLVYTPFYIGLAEGLFAENGVELNATLSPSGEETAAGAAGVQAKEERTGFSQLTSDSDIFKAPATTKNKTNHKTQSQRINRPSSAFFHPIDAHIDDRLNIHFLIKGNLSRGQWHR